MAVPSPALRTIPAVSIHPHRVTTARAARLSLRGQKQLRVVEILSRRPDRRIVMAEKPIDVLGAGYPDIDEATRTSSRSSPWTSAPPLQASGAVRAVAGGVIARFVDHRVEQHVHDDSDTQGERHEPESSRH